MARVMPGGGTDTTSQFLMQLTHGNQALARMYAQMLAKYEDRLEQQAFQREMFGARTAEGDRRRDEANREWYNRQDYSHNLRNPQAPQQPNLLGPGAGGSGMPAPAAAAAPTTPPVAAAPAERPSVYTLDKNPYSGSGAGTSAPVAPAPKVSDTGVSPKVAALLKSGAADALAGSGEGHTEFSAQSRTTALPPTGTPSVSTPVKPYRREAPPPTQLPNVPGQRQPRNTPKPQAQYLDIDQRWLDLMHTEEDKHKLPRGSLMTLYGLENGGGRVFGQNPKSSATGIFQFSADLRAEHKLSDVDTRDPAKMIPAAAANLRRNADVLKREYKIDLPTTPESMQMWAILHQWGVRAGPRIVETYLKNPDTPMIQIMGTHKDAQGNVIPNYNVLARNNIDPASTVGQVIRSNKAPYWMSGYAQQFPQHADQPPGQYKSVPAPQLQQPVEQPLGRPPAASETGTMGANPRLVAAVRGGATYLPEGYTVRQTSGHRPHGSTSSHHYRRNAGDFQIYKPDGTPIENKGGDTTGLYTLLARGVKTWVTNNDPQLLPHIGYGGAFGTKLGGGGVPDLMHYDLGGSRGRMVPDVQFARLRPIGDAERTQIAQRYGVAAPQQAAAPQQPVRLAGPMPQSEPTRPYVTSAISRIPTSGEVGATFAARDKAPAAEAAPPLNIPLISTPIKAGDSGLAARSDPYYNLENDIGAGIPTLNTRDVPLPPERPITESGDLGGTGTPADAPLPGLDEQLDIQTNAPQVPLPPLKPPETEFTPADRTPMVGAPATLTGRGEHGQYGDTPPDSVQDAMADAFRQRTEPGYKTADFNVIPQVAVGDIPPQGQISSTAKQPLPAEFEAVTPAQRAAPSDFTITPQLDVPTTIARAPLPPGFKVPLPTLGGDDASAAANAPTNQMPRDLQQLPLPARLPPELPRPVSSGNAPTIRSIVDAIYSGNIPSLAVSPDPNAKNYAKDEPDLYTDYVRSGDSAATMEKIGEWLKQNFGPGSQPENQKIFHQAVRDYVTSGANAVTEWWNRPPTAKPTTQSGPPAPPVAAQQPPVRTMPDGRPYFPPPEPLVVPPRKGAAGPTNTTLSNGPGGTALPAPPGQVNPLTGRIDVPKPTFDAEGNRVYTEPGEVVDQVVE